MLGAAPVRHRNTSSAFSNSTGRGKPQKATPPSWRPARTAARRASGHFVIRGAPSQGVRLGLKENWRQFALLVLVNAFVGGMVGLERTVVPLIGSEEFGLVLRTAIFSFIISFGIVKALSNL